MESAKAKITTCQFTLAPGMWSISISDELLNMGGLELYLGEMIKYMEVDQSKPLTFVVELPRVR